MEPVYTSGPVYTVPGSERCRWASLYQQWAVYTNFDEDVYRSGSAPR
jgi:hypothetical protein